MDMSCPKSATSRTTWAVLLGSWLITYFFARVLLKEHGAVGIALSPDTSGWVRALISLVPIVPAGLAILAFGRDIQQSDELERRIHLEALAFAFPLVLLMLMILGMLEVAIQLNPEDWSFRHVWYWLPFLWLIGYFRARQRYGVK